LVKMPQEFRAQKRLYTENGDWNLLIACRKAHLLMYSG
jgi:hypothetical protein